MAHFDELMQRALTVRNNVAPSSNTAILVGGVLVSIVSALQLLLDTKQGTLTFDDEPTDGSTNPVTSDGIYEAIADAIASIDLSACEKIVNKVTAIDSQSTDVQYPTAKLLYDSLQALANVYAPIYHTHHYTDIEQPAIVATAGALGYTIDDDEYSHIITLTADTTLYLPTITPGTARIMRLTLIQDLTGGHGVTFDGGNAQVYNPYQVDLSQGLGGYRCWVTLWFDGAQWCYIATPYVLRSESQFDYTISGTSTGASVTITINGSTMNIPVNAGAWEYGYNGAVTSLSLAGDTGVTTIDFSLSDGLAGVTSLAGAFSGCSALQSIDFTDCDLSAIVDATNAFSGCSALTALTIPSGEWLPDLDLSATAIGYSAMAGVIIGLHTYASGTHTVTFNATIWDALTQAQQQTISDAASAKGWTTNAKAFKIKGSCSIGTTQITIRLRFIEGGTPEPTALEYVVPVDAAGKWQYTYSGKKLISLNNFVVSEPSLLTIDLAEADDLQECEEIGNQAKGFYFADNCPTLTTISFRGKRLDNVKYCRLLGSNTNPNTIDLTNATFENLLDGRVLMRSSNITSVSLPEATFNSLSDYGQLFYNCATYTEIDMPKATFANLKSVGGAGGGADLGMFMGCTALQRLNMPKATFASLTHITNMFANCTALTTFAATDNNIALPSTATAASLNMSACQLTYQSMLNMSNWLANLTGYSAKTITFKTSAWNALSSAEQANIDTILSGKNWTRVLAA